MTKESHRTEFAVSVSNWSSSGQLMKMEGFEPATPPPPAPKKAHHLPEEAASRGVLRSHAAVLFISSQMSKAVVFNQNTLALDGQDEGNIYRYLHDRIKQSD
jgi:hypothetical protein